MSSIEPAGPQRSTRQMSPFAAAKAQARLSDPSATKLRRDSGKDINAIASSPQTPLACPTSKRKPAVRRARHFVEEPLYLLPTHYALLQDSTFELLRGLANLSSTVEDDSLYFDQLLGAAVNVKHAFDLGRMDVINGTIRPRNTSLCHECITTVSSVWRSGPDGPRTLCNACGLRYYKQNQRRALETKRRESRDTADAAASLAALGTLDIKAARKLLSGNVAAIAGRRGASPFSYQRARDSIATSASTGDNADVCSDDDGEEDDGIEDADEGDSDGDRDNDDDDKNICDRALPYSTALGTSRQSISCASLTTTTPLAATNHTSLPDYSHYHHHANSAEHSHAVTLPSIASLCNRMPPLLPPPSRLPLQQQPPLPPLLLPPFQPTSTPLHQQHTHMLSAPSSSMSSLTSSSPTPLIQIATSSRTMHNSTSGADGAPTYAPQYYRPSPANGSHHHHPYYPPQP